MAKELDILYVTILPNVECVITFKRVSLCLFLIAESAPDQISDTEILARPVKLFIAEYVRKHVSIT